MREKWLKIGMRKRQIVEVVLLAVLLLMSLNVYSAVAQSSLPLPTECSDIGDIPCSPDGEGFIQKFVNFFGGYRAGDKGIVGLARPIISAAAILMIIMSALKILLANGEEGKIEQAKKGLTLGVMGLLIISLAGEATKVLSLQEDAIKTAFPWGEQLCYGSPTSDPNSMQCRAVLFNGMVNIVITFLKYIIAGVAVFQIILGGTKLITNGGEEDKVTEVRKKLIWGTAGLVIFFLANPVINKVFYRLDYTGYVTVDGVRPEISPSEGIAQIAGFTNLVVSIVGPLVVLVLIAGGVMYAISGGDETKIQTAKRTIFAALIGIIVIYGAFGLVSTAISGQYSG